MKLFLIKYVSTVYMEIEGISEDDALITADRLLFDMTGADFRECCDFESIELSKSMEVSSHD